MAPLASNSTMYTNIPNGTVEGGISVAVPGEVMGYWEAHKLMGKLPWRDLFQPTIKLAQEGFPCEQSAADAIKSKISSGIFERRPLLKQLVTNPVTNTWYKAGETVRLPLLAKTLIRLAEGGAPEFYNGSLADEMVEEIQGAGGIITKADFKGYFADVTEPLHLNLHANLKIFTPGLPSGGPVLLYVLNILSGYNMTSRDISTDDKTVLTYHRILEAFKHAYAARSEMGSPYGETTEFIEEMKQLVANITSPEQGADIRARISDSTTFPWTSYNPSFIVQDDHGTSHLAVLGPNGDAVSVTSTINLFFGSKVVGSKTGILFNDMMDDFSVPGVVNGFLVQPSPANFIKPTKRPLSSMSPSIVVNKDGLPVLVVGCAGGTKIISTTAFLTALTLWLDEGIKSAIDAPRIHHQLYPDEAILSNAPKWLADGLRQKGHKVSEVTGSISTPTGILQRVAGAVTANGENSVVDGY
ncbi:unnamed protein product [Lymnaea stagnalis]|uniref:Uncharacterized protein n=1 Tax=Lymnaea stagnalis TaxID=6523 RepID=A0AAV2IBD8_LYMST